MPDERATRTLLTVPDAFTLKAIVMGAVTEEDGDLESTVSFSGNTASMSALAANDEFSYVAT